MSVFIDFLEATHKWPVRSGLGCVKNIGARFSDVDSVSLSVS
jgi:hypothetical protein